MTDDIVETGDGADIEGDVSTGGGDFVGRDKRIEAETYIEHVTFITQPAEAEEERGQAPAEGDPPYMGLRYFDVGDAGLFFGREALTAQLVARLKEGRFLAVVGASGSGKSSLARAGLLPALMGGEPLADGSLPPPGSERWQYRVMTPTAHPLRELAVCLLNDPGLLDAANTLIKEFAGNAHSLDVAASMALRHLGGEWLLLLVDQFEELFTLCRDEAERLAFIDNLLVATSEETAGATIVVITLRADFYHHCVNYPRLRNILECCQAIIGAMSQDELRQAIEAPARQGEWEFEEGLVDLMLRDVSEEPGSLPLLSHALLETWKRRRGRCMTLTGYQEAGGVRGAIAQTAERTYRGLSQEEQVIARNIFLRLTELGEGTQDTRRRAGLDELLPSAEQRPQVEAVLKILADARLVTTHQDCAEVAHEALIREWPALKEWLEEDRESLRLHRHLTESAQSWRAMGRDEGDLYRGTRLAGALVWARQHDGELSALERQFLEASRGKQRREARLRNLRWAGAAALVALLTLVIALATSGRLNRLIYRPLSMEWVRVPAGEFLMGSSEKNIAKTLELCPDCEASWFDNEQPQHAVYLDEFEITAYEVTNAQYAQCVKAGVCLGAGSSSDLDTESAAYPVNSLNWHDAQAFCEWVGGRLPMEAEWEKAARGGLVGVLYPWGDDPPVCTEEVPNGAQFDECSGQTVPVGSFSPNGFGLYDVAGDVWEWVGDWYGGDYYAVSPSENPQGPGSGDDRVLRGGSWINRGSFLRVAIRVRYPPDVRNDFVGFRCSRSP